MPLATTTAQTDLPPGWSSHVNGSDLIMALTGCWSVQTQGGSIGDAIPLADRNGIRTLSFDTSSLGTWDSSLLVFLAALQTQCTSKRIAFDDSGLPDTTRRLLSLLSTGTFEPTPTVNRTALVVVVGKAAIGLWTECIAVTALVGDTVLRSGMALTGRARMRGKDLLVCMQVAGLSALPIVAIVNLLVGGILAFVGSVQLERFGAVIYVANLVGIAVVREMAPLMTAIVMAGRTGGAYAAEIASMQGAEEIDALRAIGIPIHDYLLLPRILALTAMMPLLYLYGSTIGILGGMAVSVAMLRLSPASFVNELLGAFYGSQIIFGIGKSICFGALVSIVGCRIGLKAGRSAADVGNAATSAVVSGIVGIIALDAVFAVCANALDF